MPVGSDMLWDIFFRNLFVWVPVSQQKALMGVGKGDPDYTGLIVEHIYSLV